MAGKKRGCIRGGNQIDTYKMSEILINELRDGIIGLNEWQSINQQNYTMAINLSPRQFRDPELVNIITAEIVEARGMKQVTDTGAIEAAVDEIIAANPAQVEKAQANPKLAGWFVGQVMKATGGKANPKAVDALVKSKLGL